MVNLGFPIIFTYSFNRGKKSITVSGNYDWELTGKTLMEVNSPFNLRVVASVNIYGTSRRDCKKERSGGNYVLNKKSV